ncbi:NUDIX hydrolase domain containing protein [Rhodotorula toruloides]|uniref:BY PROTMAP: gi/472584258/gb/EMS21864.1/ NUDIX hydrolase domain containing protein [Rhodosporidium toruloides NP11] gi/647394416/emb/CDR35645.1/ RHTO0S01e03972g1_1 [Rhodosporidium toruloides] n=2 Tax=Rhodotorula toruloides TaxID=5286 RepID=A0A0K3CIJ6_RHOTO|nr:NUDIX hydrolase domain containing protein [Rhodotorula toruloides]
MLARPAARTARTLLLSTTRRTIHRTAMPAASSSRPPNKGPSLSASLVLLAPLPAPAPDGHDYRVLLLKRHAQSRTYDSAHVMPGGNIDPIDLDSAAWASFFPSASKASPPSTSSLIADKLLALRLCAIRETFEESGLLLLKQQASSVNSPQSRWNGLDPEEKTRWREAVHEDGKEFIQLLRRLGGTVEPGAEAKPAVDSLTHWSNWVTPVLLPRRFDTHFFISVLPSPEASGSGIDTSASTTAVHDSLVSSDGVETTSADWLTPLEAIKRAVAHPARRGENASPQPPSDIEPILLHPPQFNLLAELAHNHRTLASLLDSSASSATPLVRPRRVVPLTPQIANVMDDQGRERKATVLPGDEEYQYDDEAVGSAPGVDRAGKRNRTYVIPPRKGQQGLVVEGCIRRGMVEVLGEGWEDMWAGEAGRAGEGAKL